MKKVIRLTERDLSRIVKRVIKESFIDERDYDYIMEILANEGLHPNSEWFDEFEHSRFYDDNMTDDEYAEALYDFIIYGDNESQDPISKFTEEELGKIYQEVLNMSNPVFFEDWEARNYLYYKVANKDKELFDSLVQWMDGKGFDTRNL
jgi:hypothetical protein